MTKVGPKTRRSGRASWGHVRSTPVHVPILRCPSLARAGCLALQAANALRARVRGRASTSVGSRVRRGQEYQAGTMVKACDACHLRRTKCSGDRPCRGCSISDLNCTYERRSRKKGPQGKTVAQLRATFGAASGSSPSSSPISPGSDLFQPNDLISTTTVDWAQPVSDLFQPRTDLASDLFATWTTEPTSSTTNGAVEKISALHTYLFSPPVPDSPFGLHYHSGAAQLRLLDDLLSESTQSFFKHIYPLYPVVDSANFRQRLAGKVHLYDKQFAALVLSTAILAILLPSSDPIKAAAAREKADTLTDMAISLHNVSDLGNRPTLDCIGTSMMLSSSALVLKSPAVAYVRHREAVSLAELLNLTDPNAYDGFELPDKEVALRIFWALTIAERSVRVSGQYSTYHRSNSLILSRPITLKSPLTNLPVNFQLQSGLSFGLRPTARLYELMAPSLIDCINSRCSPQTCSLSTQLALNAHRNLSDIGVDGCVSEVQIADTILSSQWMHIKIWQACVSHSLLNFGALQPELRIEYPLTCLLEVVNATQTLPKRSIFGNGHVMGLKLRTIADAAEATLNLPQPLSLPVGWNSVDHVKEALQGLRRLASGVAAVQWSRWLEDASSVMTE